MRLLIRAAFILAFATAPALPSTPTNQVFDLKPILEKVRKQSSLPAVAAAVICDGELKAAQVVGVRKWGSPERAKLDDPFHLGSCTKAMTASLIGVLVREGKLKWETRIADTFPEMKGSLSPGYRAVTLTDLLSHRDGAPQMTQSLDPLNEQEHEDLKMISPPRRQREKFVSLLLSRPPIRKRGEEELYSNAGFSVAGAMAEKVTGEEYEALLARTIFKPLAMTTAGFGAMGTPDKVDAPWQHELKNGKPVPVNPGPFSDNPPYLAPGGRVHCSIGDWAKYVQSVLRALRNEKGLLSRADVGQLLSPPYSGEYALGWKICERDWAGGRAYTHGGSNGRNFCIVWISPTRNFAVLVATNCGGDRVFNDLDGLCGQLISKFLQ